MRMADYGPNPWDNGQENFERWSDGTEYTPWNRNINFIADGGGRTSRSNLLPGGLEPLEEKKYDWQRAVYGPRSNAAKCPGRCRWYKGQ